MQEPNTMRSAGIPPPLPPKTRRNTAAATGLGGGASSIGTMNLVRFADNSNGEHVVKIRINPPSQSNDGCVRISVGDDMVRRSTDNFIKERGSPYFFCNSFQCTTNGMVTSSGQSSPSDTLDSGTCSDLDGSTPPPLPKKSTIASGSNSNTVTVTVNGSNHQQHHRTGSLTSSGAEVDSEDDVGSNISYDSLNGHEFLEEIDIVRDDTQEETVKEDTVSTALATQFKNVFNTEKEHGVKVSNPVPSSNGFLPEGLLQDIRDRSAKLTIVPVNNVPAKKNKTWREEPIQRSIEVHEKQQQSSLNFHKSVQKTRSVSPITEESPRKNGIVEERTYEERSKERTQQSPEPVSVKAKSYKYEDDRFYKFHLREHEVEPDSETRPKVVDGDDETFAGLKHILGDKNASGTIISTKGTVRGVRNRVRAGIATFLQIPDTKNYKEKEVGKVVVYTTTMGIVRETFQECLKVKKILRTLLVKFEERDVFMSREVQAEIRERMHCDAILVPQVFVEGQHIGDAETIERLNETGELRRIMRPFKSPDACTTCQVCGGFRLLPCTVCNGSKKSIHRNDFTAEFVALKCMNCDEVGLVRCYAC